MRATRSEQSVKQLYLGHCELCDGTGKPGPYREEPFCPKCNGAGSSLLFQVMIIEFKLKDFKDLQSYAYQHSISI